VEASPVAESKAASLAAQLVSCRSTPSIPRPRRSGVARGVKPAMASTTAPPPPIVLDKLSQTLFTLTNNAGTPGRRTAQLGHATQTMLTPRR